MANNNEINIVLRLKSEGIPFFYPDIYQFGLCKYYDSLTIKYLTLHIRKVPEYNNI